MDTYNTVEEGIKRVGRPATRKKKFQPKAPPPADKIIPMEKGRLSNMNINKGVSEKGFRVFAWDAVDECTGEVCQLHEECPYKWRERHKNGSPCAVQSKYLQYVMQRLYDFAPETASDVITRIGTELLPLYAHLIKFKMLEHQMRSNRLMFDDKGKPYINPIYKEIRSTIASISAVWAGLHLAIDRSSKRGLSAGDLKGEMDGAGSAYMDMLMGGTHE